MRNTHRDNRKLQLAHAVNFSLAALMGAALLFASRPAQADAVCAKQALTLRTGPGTRNPVSWKVAKYMPFLRLERKNGWAKVQDLEGEVHWALNSAVSSSIRCVVVKTNIANLHKDPILTSAAPDLKTLDRYTPLKRIGGIREWIQVEDEAGHQAWVHESQVWKPVMVNSFSF